MSYCRWSSDNFKCDLYCYGCDTGYVTHVARNRIVGDVPTIHTRALLDGAREEFNKSLKMHDEFLDTCERVSIGLEHDGKCFVDRCLEDFRDKIVELIEMGYRVPDYVLEEIDEEMKEKHNERQKGKEA